VGTLGAVDFSTWIPGWISLGAVIFYGALLISLATSAKVARDHYQLRILVTGSRGKSGTVRLIHSGLANSGIKAYGKVTGTIAVELLPDGSEKATSRLGTAGISEMPQAVKRGMHAGATHGVFECMAVSPRLIHTVQAKYVQAQIVVIPTIRLDHLEDEGLDEFEIGMNILNAVEKCDFLVTGVNQPDLMTAYKDWCEQNGAKFINCSPNEYTPEVPGHHPVNVAVAQAVCELAGIAPETAALSLQLAGLEPRALELYQLNLDGTETLLVDIGGANDPESAVDALKSWHLENENVLPVLVNRWERPLRSVIFSASLAGNYPLALVSGPLYHWLSRPETLTFLRSAAGTKVWDTSFIQLSYLDCLFPQRVIRKVKSALPELADGRLVLLLVENTHGSKVDILRSRFERGLKLSQSEVFGK
jgi:poly-gamma-glutamate synthase PgsB/CapB